MFSEIPMKSRYTGSKQIIIEGDTKFCLPIFMSIQLKKYLRRFQKNNESNLVMEWYNMLEVHEKAEVEVTRLN